MRRLRAVSPLGWAFLAACVLIAFGIAALVIGLSSQVSSNRHLARQGKQAHDALCFFKTDLQQRVDGTRDFLAAHPDGVAGISRADIQRSIDNQRATLDSLKSLTCPAKKGIS